MIGELLIVGVISLMWLAAIVVWTIISVNNFRERNWFEGLGAAFLVLVQVLLSVGAVLWKMGI